MNKKITGSIFQCGREITIHELEEIRECVKMFWRLSRSELAQTICEHLEWFAATGANKTDAGMKLLEHLEAKGLLQLPEKRPTRKSGPEGPVQITDRTDPQPEIVGSLRDSGLIRLDIVKDKETMDLWKEYIQRYHYLGYKKPFGCYLRYFFKCERGLLGCALFSGASKSMGMRDRWIGWTEDERSRNQGWVINNARFLIFPWVKVRYLASHVLGHIARRIVRDWEELWGYKPVLMETFVDPERYEGVSYKASNWHYLGMTTGVGLVRKGKKYATRPKKLFVKPLAEDFRAILCSENLVGRVEI